MIKRFITYSLVFAALAIVALSCEDRSYYKGSDARVYFSLDTVSFDTIFTTIGSATLNFRVYNRYDQPINIENIRLVGGDASNFRMNVDGYQGTS